jgi:heme A synthase
MKTILQKTLLLIALMIFFETNVYAEEVNSNQVSKIMDKFAYSKTTSQQKPTVNTTADNITAEVLAMQIKANIQFVQITAALYAFALIIIIVFMWDKKHQSKDIVTMVGMVSVIFGAILLVLMVGGTDQLTAPMGILGAIVGYLFGASKQTEKSGEG